MRIELTQSAWKAEVLPLNYTCISRHNKYTINLSLCQQFYVEKLWLRIVISQLIREIYYISISNNSIIIPERDPNKYNNIKIEKFSLRLWFSLNKIIKAVPLPVRRPLISDDMLIVLFIYNSVKMTLAPQFGINPIRLDISGAKIDPLRKIFDKNSSPR